MLVCSSEINQVAHAPEDLIRYVSDQVQSSWRMILDIPKSNQQYKHSITIAYCIHNFVVYRYSSIFENC
jgi:hypothetical protein